MIQNIITSIVIAVAAAYIVWHIIKHLKIIRRNGTTEDCTKEACKGCSKNKDCSKKKD